MPFFTVRYSRRDRRPVERDRRPVERALAAASAAQLRETIVITATERAGLQPRL